VWRFVAAWRRAPRCALRKKHIKIVLVSGL
jgi:hypothetical protein